MKKYLCFALFILLFFEGFALTTLAAGYKPAVDAGLLYDTYTETPVIINTKYPSNDTVVADFIVTNPVYGADYTGAEDCSDILQAAINDCAAHGGGTVFIPSGRYLVTKSLTVFPNVTLVGDFSQRQGEFGTVILCDTPVSESLFILNPSSGIRGLTVFYPRQSIENVIPYAPTVFVSGGMMFTVQECLFLNSYDGIKTEGHEMLTVDTLRGSFLHTCIDAKNQSDVGTFKNITVSPEYWAFAGAEYNAPGYGELAEYTKANLTALRLGDLEWAEFININLYDCNIGVHTVEGERVEFCGQFYGLNVFNSVVAFYAEKFDTSNWGIEFANCYLEGSEASFKNDISGSPVKAAATVFDGAIQMNNTTSLYRKTETLPDTGVDYYCAAVKPEQYLYDLSDYGLDNDNGEDISGKLQEVLDAAAGTGGIVYLPAGNYRLESPVSVPAGVELRGSGASPRRLENGASNIFVYYGKNADPMASAAAVTLSGAGAGIKQLGFVYPENYSEYDPQTETFLYDDYSFTIEAVSENNYIENCAIAASANSIHLNGADDHFIKKLVSTSYYNTFYVENCENGVIEGCLQNGTLASRAGSDIAAADTGLSSWCWGGYVENGSVKIYPEFMFNDPTSATLVHITLENVKNQKIMNVFTFASNKYFTSYDSSAVLINTGADYFKGDRMLSVYEGSDITAINLMRVTSENRCYYYDETGNLQIYSQMKAGMQMERDETHFNNVIKCDTDNNGKVGISDIMKIFRYVSGKYYEKRPEELFMYAADIDGNNKVEISDAITALKILAGKEDIG